MCQNVFLALFDRDRFPGFTRNKNLQTISFSLYGKVQFENPSRANFRSADISRGFKNHISAFAWSDECPPGADFKFLYRRVNCKYIFCRAYSLTYLLGVKSIIFELSCKKLKIFNLGVDITLMFQCRFLTLYVS